MKPVLDIQFIHIPRLSSISFFTLPILPSEQQLSPIPCHNTTGNDPTSSLPISSSGKRAPCATATSASKHNTLHCMLIITLFTWEVPKMQVQPDQPGYTRRVIVLYHANISSYQPHTVRPRSRQGSLPRGVTHVVTCRPLVLRAVQMFMETDYCANLAVVALLEHR